MTDKRSLIVKMQQDLKLAGFHSKIMQFDIKILELEEEIERLQSNKLGCKAEINKILNSEEETG